MDVRDALQDPICPDERLSIISILRISIGLGLILVDHRKGFISRQNSLSFTKQITKFWVEIFCFDIRSWGGDRGNPIVQALGRIGRSYSRYVGDVFLAVRSGRKEFFAFFLEAGFLGVMLFGWG